MLGLRLQNKNLYIVLNIGFIPFLFVLKIKNRFLINTIDNCSQYGYGYGYGYGYERAYFTNKDWCSNQ
jgi:hypothetical protein